MTDILLATYNGGKYLSELLESLLSQTEEDWRIIVRDDGSSDKTPAMLADFAEKHPGKMKIVKDGLGNLRSIGNFFRLMELSDAEYTMFCDQDDIWLPDKISVTLKRMKELESEGVPVLVHTDLIVADSEGRQTAPSFIAEHGLDAAPQSPVGMAFRNGVTGCTVMINRSLRELAGARPAHCTMHDHFLAEIALAAGRLGYVDRATILYRQHEANVCGSHKKSAARKLALMLDIPGWKRALKRTEDETEKNLAQAREVLVRCSDAMPPASLRAYERLLAVKRLPAIRRPAELEALGCLPGARYERTAIKLCYFFAKRERG